MAEEQAMLITVDGQEIAVADYVNAGRTGGLATDRAIAEMLRFPPYDGTNVYKSILAAYVEQPEGGGGATAVNPGVVTSGPGSNGSVQVNPFTAIIGSRTAPSASPTDPTWTGARQNLSDIRTAVYTGTTTLATVLSLAANASGNPRYDLVYATVSVDVQAGSTVRRVKNAATGALSTQSVPTYVANPVTVGVVTGTPGATPTIPALPADTAGNYNIAIAALWIPTGFTSASTVLSTQIRDVVGCAQTGTISGSGGQTIAMLAPSTGASSGPFPASGNNDRGGAYATNFPWATARPGPFLPPTMMGGVQCFTEIDLVNAVSHANNAIVDDTIDWRNRFTLAFLTGDSALPFANDPAIASGNIGVPSVVGNLTSGSAFSPFIQMSNTFSNSDIPSILFLNNSMTSLITAPGAINLYVHLADGTLRVTYTSPIAFRFFVWIMASAQFPNL